MPKSGCYRRRAARPGGRKRLAPGWAGSFCGGVFSKTSSATDECCRSCPPQKPDGGNGVSLLPGGQDPRNHSRKRWPLGLPGRREEIIRGTGVNFRGGSARIGFKKIFGPTN